MCYVSRLPQNERKLGRDWSGTDPAKGGILYIGAARTIIRSCDRHQGGMAMARAMSVEQPAQAMERVALPYPPSWVDRLTEWVRRLPGPSWLYYLGAWVALLVLEMAVKVYDGTYGPGAMIPVPFHVVVT